MKNTALIMALVHGIFPPEILSLHSPNKGKESAPITQFNSSEQKANAIEAVNLAKDKRARKMAKRSAEANRKNG